MAETYRVGEFARMMQVSLRTLHHYDQIGLLSPSSYSEGAWDWQTVLNAAAAIQKNLEERDNKCRTTTRQKN